MGRVLCLLLGTPFCRPSAGQGKQKKGNQVRQASKEWKRQFSLEKIKLMKDKKEKVLLHCPQCTVNVKHKIVVVIHLSECAD